MPSLLTTRDPQGGMRFRPLAIPLLIAAIAVPVAAAMALSGTQLGAGLGMAVGALAATSLIVFAARSKPMRRVEVAESADAGHRVLVVAVTEATAEAAERIAELSGSPSDVRVVVPVASQRLDRWLSAEDEARHEAEARLARAAGTLVAAGLPVSGSVGDPDPAQALEDELRDFPADEVILLTDEDEDPLGKVGARLGLPLRRVALANRR
jgi:nucleotide-binding universal stress UspA family protein